MEIEVQEQQLPGIGRCWQFETAEGRLAIVVARSGGGCEITTRWPDRDAADTSLRLTAQEAALLGSLLVGARFR